MNNNRKNYGKQPSSWTGDKEKSDLQRQKWASLF